MGPSMYQPGATTPASPATAVAAGPPTPSPSPASGQAAPPSPSSGPFGPQGSPGQPYLRPNTGSSPAPSPYSTGSLQARSPAPSAGSLTPAASPSASPVVRPSTPQPVLNQHHLVQIIHPGFMNKAKQPPQILPKPSSGQNSSNKAPPPPPPLPRNAVSQTMPTANSGGGPTGALLLGPGGVLLQQNNGSVQLILRPSTPATPSQVSAQQSLPSTTSSSGITTVVPPKTLHPSQATQQPGSASQPIIISGSPLLQGGRPQQVIRFIQGTMQLPQFSGPPAYIAVPSNHHLSFPTPTLAPHPQAPAHPLPLPPPPLPIQHHPTPAPSPSSESIIKNSNSLCIDSDGSEVEGSLQPPKKKPKKRKKKRKEEETKMDLANIMKLSGIGDEDDLVEDSNHSSIQHSPQSGNPTSQSSTPTQQTPPTNHLQSSTTCLKRKNVVLHQDNQNMFQGLHGLQHEQIALAHSQLSALIAAHSGANGLSSNALANTLMSAIGSASATGHNNIQHSQQSTSSPVNVSCQPPQQTINSNQSIGLTINSSSQTLGLNVSTQNISSSHNSTLNAVSNQALTMNSSSSQVLNHSLSSNNISNHSPLGLSLSASSTQALNINSSSQNLNLNSASNQSLNTSQSQTLHLSLNPATTQGLTLGTNTNPQCLTLNSASQPLNQSLALNATQGLAINSSQAQAHFHSLNSVTANQASCITLNSSNQQGISLNTSQAQFTLNSATSSNPTTPQLSLNLNSGQANLAAAMSTTTTAQTAAQLGINLNQNSIINPSSQSLQLNSATSIGLNSHSQTPVGITLNPSTQGPCLTLNTSQNQPCITINSATTTQPLGLTLNPQVTLNSNTQTGQPCLTIPTGQQGHLILSQLLSGGDGSKSIGSLLRVKDIDSGDISGVSGEQLVIAHPSLLPGLLNMQLTNLGGKLTLAPSGAFLINPQPTETKQQPKPSVLVQQLTSGIRRSSTDSNQSNHSSSLGSPPPIINHSNHQRKPITPKGKIHSPKNQQFCNNSVNSFSTVVSSPPGTFCFTTPTSSFTFNQSQSTFSISSSSTSATQPTFTLSGQPVTTTRTTSSSTFINTTQPNYSVAKLSSMPITTNKTNFSHSNSIPSSTSSSLPIGAPFISNSSHSAFTLPNLIASTSQQTFSLNSSSNSQARLSINHSKVISPEKISIPVPVHNQKHPNIGTFVNLPISTTSSSFTPSTTIVTTQATGFTQNQNSQTVVSSSHQSSNIPSHTTIPHLVPISTSTTTSGSTQLFHNVQTIQLSAHNQKQLKSVQNQISTLNGRKNSGASEKEALSRLYAEQQRILSTGKLVHPPRCYHHQVGNQVIQLHGKVTTSTTPTINTSSQSSSNSSLQSEADSHVPNNNNNSNNNVGTVKTNNNPPTPNPGAIAAANAAVSAAAAAVSAASTLNSISQSLPNTCEKGTSPLQVQVGTQTAEPTVAPVNNNTSPHPVQPHSMSCSQTTTTSLSLNTPIVSNISTTPSTHVISSVSSSFSNSIASHSLSPRGIKRQATSPARSQICRTDLIEQQLRRDQQDARESDTHTPFRSKDDACKRLIRYHVYNEQLLSQRDLEKADEIYEEATAKHLLDKFKQMMQKYRYLLLKESMKEVNTSELIMLDRLFVAEEQLLLRQLREDEEHKAQETSPTDESEPYDEWEAIQKELGVYCPGEGPSNEIGNKPVSSALSTTTTHCVTTSSTLPITTIANTSSPVVTTSCSTTAMNSTSVSERGIDLAQSHPSLAASVSVQRPAACLQILETHASPEHCPTVLPVRKRINKVKPEDDEISAQVQSAIESILNLQHSGDGYEAPGSGSKTGLLPADIDGDETRAEGDSALDEAVRSIILS